MHRWILVAALALAACKDPPPSGSGTVDEIVARADRLEGREVSARGWVVAGSIEETIVDGEGHLTFALEANRARVGIRYSGVKPDALKGKEEFFATGRLRRDAGGLVIDATRLVWCRPSPGRAGGALQAVISRRSPSAG